MLIALASYTLGTQHPTVPTGTLPPPKPTIVALGCPEHPQQAVINGKLQTLGFPAACKGITHEP
jgi:hypothetical protein